MTKQLTAIDSGTDTFQVWLDRFNEMISAANTEFMTANTNANGSVTVGNTFLSGIFYATTLSTTNLRGGNVQSSGNLHVTSNLYINSAASYLYIGNSTVNVIANSSTIQISGRSVTTLQEQINVQTSGTSAQLIDSFLKASFRGAEYVISVADNAANNFQFSKALVFHDSGADAYIQVFADAYTNSYMATYTANANTTHTRLYITPVQSNTQVKASKTVVAL